MSVALDSSLAWSSSKRHVDVGRVSLDDGIIQLFLCAKPHSLSFLQIVWRKVGRKCYIQKLWLKGMTFEGRKCYIPEAATMAEGDDI